MKNVLLTFIKNPEFGKVKTRLSATMGHQRALEVYDKLLALTRSVTRQISCHRQLWYSQFIDEDDDWDARNYEKKLQQGSNLGQRMQYAFEQVFTAGYKRAVLIGSDCAELTPSHIQQAFTALENHDAVIGPSQDGGYYLLGMKAVHPKLFLDIDWSTPSVFDDTISRMQSLNLSCAHLSTLNDIDTEEDLRESGQRLQDI